MKRVVFVCVHNSARSQMAEALLNRLAIERGAPIRALSAGTLPGKEINPTARKAMEELGISMDAQQPKLLTESIVDSADQLVTMGCGVEASMCPARTHFTDDWGLDDPAGQPLSEVRRIRDQIRQKVEELLDDLTTEKMSPVKGAGS